jgi:hypothetical protein
MTDDKSTDEETIAHESFVYRVSGTRLGMAGGTTGQFLPIGWNLALIRRSPQLLTQDIVHIVVRLRCYGYASIHY